MKRTREEIDAGIRLAVKRDKEWRAKFDDSSGAAEEGKPKPKWTGFIWPGYDPPDPLDGIEKGLQELNRQVKRLIGKR